MYPKEKLLYRSERGRYVYYDGPYSRLDFFLKGQQIPSKTWRVDTEKAALIKIHKLEIERLGKP